MRIRRSAHPVDNFTILPNALLEDQRLSFRTMGLLAYLASRPPGWETNVEALRHQRPGMEGRDALRTAIAEAEALGYASRVKVQDSRGRWSTVLEVGTLPRSRSATNCGLPGVGLPGVGKPGAISKTDSKTDSKSRGSSSRPVSGGGVLRSSGSGSNHLPVVEARAPQLEPEQSAAEPEPEPEPEPDWCVLADELEQAAGLSAPAWAMPL